MSHSNTPAPIHWKCAAYQLAYHHKHTQYIVSDTVRKEDMFTAHWLSALRCGYALAQSDGSHSCCRDNRQGNVNFPAGASKIAKVTAHIMNAEICVVVLHIAVPALICTALTLMHGAVSPHASSTFPLC